MSLHQRLGSLNVRVLQTGALMPSTRWLSFMAVAQ
jgi:hypothetical protein